MVRTGVRSILAGSLVLGMALFQMESAQAKLEKKEKELMEKGKVKELARSLSAGASGRVEKVSRLYSFVRDEIKVFKFKERRAASRILRDGAGREEDKARLLAKLLKGIEEKGYLATINLIKYGEDQVYSFVVIKATKREAETMSKATGGNGELIRFPLKSKGEKSWFIPLIPLSGYSIGQLSTDFYEEVEEGSGKWKRWKNNVSFAGF